MKRPPLCRCKGRGLLLIGGRFPILWDFGQFLYALGGLLLTLRIQELVGLTDPKEVVIERIKERIEITKENTKRKERLLRGRCGDGAYREKKSR